MHRTILDIETEPLPLAEIQHLMPTFSAPSNWKDEAKIAANIEEQRQAWIADAALSPLTGRICAIGYLDATIGGTEAPGHVRTEIALDATGERDLLASFWESFDTTGELHAYIGHNLHGFDVPYIVRRSWAHGLRIPYSTVFPGGRGYVNDRRFIDTMKAFQCGNSRESFTGLDRCAKFLGLPGKTEDIGAKFGEILRTDHARAIAYLERDLRTTAAIAVVMGLI